MKKGAKEIILVVDDEENIRETLVPLRSSAGHRIITATDAVDAIAKVSNHRDQVVPVNNPIAMPGIDGIALLKALRNLLPALGIIVSSGILNESQHEFAGGNERLAC